MAIKVAAVPDQCPVCGLPGDVKGHYYFALLTAPSHWPCCYHLPEPCVGSLLMFCDSLVFDQTFGFIPEDDGQYAIYMRADFACPTCQRADRTDGTTWFDATAIMQNEGTIDWPIVTTS